MPILPSEPDIYPNELLDSAVAEAAASTRQTVTRGLTTAVPRSSWGSTYSTNAATATPSFASMPPDPRIAVCPGSYDPVTYGHVDVITRAAAMFDELIVAVVAASVRKSHALFTPEERIASMRAARRRI